MFLSHVLSSSHHHIVGNKKSTLLSTFVAMLSAGIIAGSSHYMRQDDKSSMSHNPEPVTPLSFSAETIDIVTGILDQYSEKKSYMQSPRISVNMPLGQRGAFFSHIFHDLHLDADVMLSLIIRESKGLSHVTSPKGAKGLMQVRDIVLEDMRGLAGVKKYGKLFLSISIDTIAQMSLDSDKEKLVGFQNIVRQILLISGNAHGDRMEMERLIMEYDQFLFSFRTELYHPELNVFFGSVLMGYIKKIANTSVPQQEKIGEILEHLDEEDINRINQLRIVDGKKVLDSGYDFRALDVTKILTLAMYNMGPNAKYLKQGVLYAIAILA